MYFQTVFQRVRFLRVAFTLSRETPHLSAKRSTSRWGWCSLCAQGLKALQKTRILALALR